MTRRCLISIYAPQNVVPAISAVRWYGIQKFAEEHAQVTTVLHMPGWNESQLDDAKRIVTQLCASQNWPAPVVLTQSQMDQITGGDYKVDYSNQEILQRFRTAIGLQNDSVTEVYYSHDVVGHATQLCMSSFPQATRLTYGESMGMMEDGDYIIAGHTGAGWDESKAKDRPKSKNPQATNAVLILPMDQTGDCLEGKELFVVPRLLVLSIISEMQHTLPEIQRYSENLLRGKDGPNYLFVVNNCADANLTSAEQEVSMYEEMIRNNIPPGATVVLKGHPLATIPIDQMLAERLGTSYGVAVVSKELNRYPMELWQHLLQECQVLAYSYCSISLEYLFAKSVIYPFSDELIEKYLHPRTWNRMKDWNVACRGQREALKKWDGRGVIWSGKRHSFAPTKAPAQEEVVTPQKLAALKNQHGVLLFQSGKHQEALESLTSALELDPSNASVHCNIGIIQWQLGSPQQALTAIQKAYELSPNDSALVVTLCQMYGALGNAEAAKATCYSFVQRHPDQIEVKRFADQLR